MLLLLLDLWGLGLLVPGGAAAGAGPGVAGSLSGLVQVQALGGDGSGPVGVSFGLTGLEPFVFAAGAVGCLWCCIFGVGRFGQWCFSSLLAAHS